MYRVHSFGLGTLHQLRGRVARGESEGQCFLLYDPKEERVELADAAGEQDSSYDDDEDHGMTMTQVAGDSKEDGEGSEESEGGDGPEKRQQRRDRQTNVARRMRMLQTCTSGFQVAEADLAARNPGEMMSDGSAGTQTGAGTQTALSSLVSLSNVS
jgi:superfamily II DNA/RNA helicase